MIAHESYRLVYEIDGSTVWILALVHTRPPAATSDGVARGAGCLHCTTSYTRPALAPIGLYAGWAAVARLALRLLLLAPAQAAAAAPLIYRNCVTINGQAVAALLAARSGIWYLLNRVGERQAGRNRSPAPRRGLSTARPRAVDNAVLHGRWPLAPGAGLRPRPLRAQRASRWSCRLLRFRWRWA